MSDCSWRQHSLYRDSEQQRLPAEQRCDWPERRGEAGVREGSPHSWCSPPIPSPPLLCPPLLSSLLTSWRTERCGDNRTQSRRRLQNARLHIHCPTATRRPLDQALLPANLALVCTQSIRACTSSPGWQGGLHNPHMGTEWRVSGGTKPTPSVLTCTPTNPVRESLTHSRH